MYSGTARYPEYSVPVRMFCSTVSCGKIIRPCGTNARPCRTRSYPRASMSSLPFSRMLPDLAGNMPISALSKVVLPMPLRPMMATDSLSFSENEMSLMTCDSRYATFNRLISSMAYS